LTATRQRQWLGAVLLVVLPAVLAWLLMPKLDFLPPVKRAAVDARFDFPPGMSAQRINAEFAPILLERMRPFMEGEREPQLSNWSLMLSRSGSNIAARTLDPGAIGELERIMREEIIVDLPDTRAFAAEGMLFGGFGNARRGRSACICSIPMGRHWALPRRPRGRDFRPCFPGANVQVTPNAQAACPNFAWCRTTGGSPKSAGAVPIWRMQCVCSARGSGLVSTSTAIAGCRSCWAWRPTPRMRCRAWVSSPWRRRLEAWFRFRRWRGSTAC
jgi:hypothetical protein